MFRKYDIVHMRYSRTKLAARRLDPVSAGVIVDTNGHHRRELESEATKPFRKTVQIATVGDRRETVLAGLRNAPANKLVLICYDSDKDAVKRLSKSIADTIKMETEVYDNIRPAHTFKDVMEVFSQILEKNRAGYEEFLVNVSSGDKMICIAAAMTSFILGFSAFYCKGNECVMLPPMKFIYKEMVSDVKMDILRALDNAGGEVKGLGKLSKLTNYGKPLLSYHINGSEDARGLVGLGLAESSAHSKGTDKFTLTTLGKMLLVKRIKA
jgi:hypothetical protein